MEELSPVHTADAHEQHGGGQSLTPVRSGPGPRLHPVQIGQLLAAVAVPG
jgi:hypothetical protein